MTPLRKRMIRELKLQRKAESTAKSYLYAVAQLAKHFNRSPDKLRIEEIRDYVHYLIVERQLSFSFVNQRLAAFRFLYREVLGQRDFDLRIPCKRPKQLPEVFSREQVAQLLQAPRLIKHRVLLMTAYGAGLRLSELTTLLPSDIHSARMLIRVRQGKGNKDRYTLLSKSLLAQLREYWRHCRPRRWLFENHARTAPMPITTAQDIYYRNKAKCGFKIGKGIHTLRHCFATHLLEGGVDLPTLQRLMGHTSLSTTMKYLHVAPARLSEISSPLDLLRLPDKQR